MKLLVTGGAGFIGSNFVHYMLDTYPTTVEIVVLDALTYAGNLENLERFKDDSRLSFYKGSICDAETVDRATDGVDGIVHFAAESHVDRSVKNPGIFVETNVFGTYVLLEAARRKNIRFHHVSTDEVFGSLQLEDAPFSEMTPYNPRSPYSASKAGSDHLVRSYFHTFGLQTTISNCSNNYGPYHFPEKLIPLVVTNLLEGKKVPVYGSGLQVRDWLFVTDHCRAIDAILQKGVIGETYCIGGDNQFNNLAIVKMIVDMMNESRDMIEFVQDRPGHDFRYDIDYSKAKKEIGWEPKVKLQDGLKQTIEWFVANESWWKKLKH